MMHLDFQGPYPICTAVHDVLDGCPVKHLSGIYLWAIEMPDASFRVSYVGQMGTSFYKRIKEHVIQMLGGNYQLCEVKALYQGWHKVLWDGLWRKGTRDKLPEYLRRNVELSNLAKSLLEVTQVFVAPVDCSPRLRVRIEGAIVESLRKANKASLIPPDNRFYFKKLEEQGVFVSIASAAPIDGLCRTLIV